MSVEQLERARDSVVFANPSWGGARARNAEHLLRRMIRHLPWVVHTERDLLTCLVSNEGAMIQSRHVPSGFASCQRRGCSQ